MVNDNVFFVISVKVNISHNFPFFGCIVFFRLFVFSFQMTQSVSKAEETTTRLHGSVGRLVPIVNTETASI